MIQNENKIVLFAPNIGVGGAEFVVGSLVNGLVRENIKVVLILATKHSTSLEHISTDVELIQFNHSRTVYSIFSLIKYLRNNKEIKLLSHLSRANRIALLANLLTGRNSLVSVVEHTTHSYAIKKKKVIPRMINKIIYKYLYPTAENIIHVSEEAARDLEIMYGWERGKVKVAYNPIVPDRGIKVNGNKPPHPWFEKHEIPVILGVGRLIPDKNYSMLVSALSIIKNKCNCRLIILGQGPERDKLEKQIAELELQDHVCLAGYVHDPYNYMKYADVFVLSSRREGLPTVLIEAMACGCPVISTNCLSGPSEILDNGKYGYLVDVDNENALAEAILSTLAKPPSSDILVERAKKYSISNSVERYIEILGTNQ
jgi:glycosyltransferase involved in cell wall biosynthesis